MTSKKKERNVSGFLVLFFNCSINSLILSIDKSDKLLSSSKKKVMINCHSAGHEIYYRLKLMRSQLWFTGGKKNTKMFVHSSHDMLVYFHWIEVSVCPRTSIRMINTTIRQRYRYNIFQLIRFRWQSVFFFSFVYVQLFLKYWQWSEWVSELFTHYNVQKNRMIHWAY